VLVLGYGRILSQRPTRRQMCDKVSVTERKWAINEGVAKQPEGV